MKIVKEIIKTGLYYTEGNNTHFIDFSECNNNWLQYRKRMENLSDSQINELKKIDRTIGQRDICAKPPFFEFFTKPFTRIEFVGQEAEKEFNKSKENINSHGWLTIDQS